MKKRAFFIRLSAALLCAALLLTGCSKTQSKIRFGAAGLGGVYNAFAASYTQLAADALSEQTFEVKTTAGSAANLRLLSQDYIQIAIAQEDLANDAYNGTGSFSETSYQGYSAVASLYTEACQIVVRADSGIDSLTDLMGKTVSIGEAESGTEQNAKQILEASGLSEKLVNEVNLNYAEAATQLNSGAIDAFFCTAGIQTTVIEELAQQCEIKLLPVSEECLQKLDVLSGLYTEYVIPAGTYTGQTEDVRTVGLRALLLVSNKLSADTVQSLTALLFEKQEELQYSVSADLQLDEQTATQGVTLPFHAGAAAYYAEQGIQVETQTSK